MNRRNFVAVASLLSALPFTWRCSALASEWPFQGQSSNGNEEGWPDFRDSRKTRQNEDILGRNNVLCAFDYLGASRTLSNFRIGRSGRPICPSGGTNFGNYFSGNRRKALETLIKQAGIRRDRIVAMEKPGFRNAAAVLCEAGDGEIKRLVIWDPQFMSDLDRKAGTKWASVAVLAHEIAHHLNLDTGQNPGAIPPHERRQQELYADRYAGAKLRVLGASRREAIAVFRQMGDGGTSHPPWQRRVAAAGQGWDGSTENLDPDPNRPRRGGSNAPPPPARPRMATICMTQYGFCRSNPRLGQVPVGARCACYTPYGVFPGIGR